VFGSLWEYFFTPRSSPGTTLPRRRLLLTGFGLCPSSLVDASLPAADGADVDFFVCTAFFSRHEFGIEPSFPLIFLSPGTMLVCHGRPILSLFLFLFSQVVHTAWVSRRSLSDADEVLKLPTFCLLFRVIQVAPSPFLASSTCSPHGDIAKIVSAVSTSAVFFFYNQRTESPLFSLECHARATRLRTDNPPPGCLSLISLAFLPSDGVFTRWSRFFFFINSRGVFPLTGTVCRPFGSASFPLDSASEARL